jgi:hypothetical protein
LISQTDPYTFTLCYFRYAERRRTDVAVFDADLLHFEWYRVNAGHVHPDVAIPDGYVQAIGSATYLTSLIEQNWQTHPVYLTDPSSPVEHRYRLSQEGPVHRVMGLREG